MSSGNKDKRNNPNERGKPKQPGNPSKSQGGKKNEQQQGKSSQFFAQAKNKGPNPNINPKPQSNVSNKGHQQPSNNPLTLGSLGNFLSSAQISINIQASSTSSNLFSEPTAGQIPHTGSQVGKNPSNFNVQNRKHEQNKASGAKPTVIRVYNPHQNSAQTQQSSAGGSSKSQQPGLQFKTFPAAGVTACQSQASPGKPNNSFSKFNAREGNNKPNNQSAHFNARQGNDKPNNQSAHFNARQGNNKPRFSNPPLYEVKTNQNRFVRPQTSLFNQFVDRSPPFRQPHRPRFANFNMNRMPNAAQNFGPRIQNLGYAPQQFKANNRFPAPSNFSSPNPNLFSPNLNLIHQRPRTPLYKFKSRPKPTPTQSSSETQNVQSLPKVYKAKKRTKISNLWKKTLPTTPIAAEAVKATPLFSLKRDIIEPELQSKIEYDSDDCDTESVSMSRCSSDESIMTHDMVISDDDMSDESSLTSEFSIISTVKSDLISNTIFTDTKKFISVYWDIENCPVPQEKSAVDFVKLVRSKFYDDRRESDFIVVCNVKNLSDSVTRDLGSSSVNIIHTSNVSKDSADKKIMSFLLDFQTNKYFESDYAILLISGDSDFSEILNTLRYKHRIYVNLICLKNARDALRESANKFIFYEDFVKELPAKSKNDSIEYCVLVSGFPPDSKKEVKSKLNNILKSVNCRVKLTANYSAEVIVPDKHLQDKVLLLLKDFKLPDCNLQMQNLQRNIDTVKIVDQISKLSVQNKTKKTKTKEKEKIEFQVSNSKGASLCICVSNKMADTLYWKGMFDNIWDCSEFTLQWEGNLVDGYFIAHFESLNKARKAKNILQKKQSSDSSAPKFLKLIKNDGILENVAIPEPVSVLDLHYRKIEDFIKMVEVKKEHYIQKHKEAIGEVKKIQTSQTDASDAIMHKMNEHNEQKVTFMNFTQNIVDKIRKIDPGEENIDKLIEDILKDYSRECNCISSALPIYARKNSVLKLVNKHQVSIIKAETGSGKSTQLTQYLWRDKEIKQKIICTQPRKIAAITLAKHVSSQIGCSLGDIVGYQVGMSSRKSDKTDILYVTDYTMLKMLINDNLDDVSCIIVDEAHERTVYTDLLLGMLKSHLKTHPKLKVVITSATIETSAFVEYFDIGQSSVIEISGRIFPIEDVWLETDVSVGWDYFTKTLDVTRSILDSSDGDILVFLTTPFETEKAMKMFTEKLGVNAKKVRVLQLHGKLDMTEQQKVFDRTPKGMKKVVFATNCAETSVTISGIKYVVDCGMVKQSQYDAVRNMNVLAVDFVSQSSAEQRRGRAGRTQIGKCYRLYSKRNFENMIKNTPPEILRVNLGQALLKLMKLGVNNPLQFDFISSPAVESLQTAMNQLILFKAVNEVDFSLTLIGEQMSCLPLEPRLSYMILIGIESGAGYEAVALAALVTVSRSIFFRNEENKSDADVKKMRFCLNESDFLTYLEVYKEWSAVPKAAKSKWCVLNCINGRSMKTVQELINEILSTLEKEASLKVIAKFTITSSLEVFDQVNFNNLLLKIIFLSFQQNLCVFSGCSKLGYKSLHVSGNLKVHPSSSLSTFDKSSPQYLVYDTLLRTNQTYLINVSPVNAEMILSGSLNIDFDALDAMQLAVFRMPNIGKTIMLRDIIGKKGVCIKKLEQEIKQLTHCEDIVIEGDVLKGQITIFAPPSKGDDINSFLYPRILEAREALLKEEKEFPCHSMLCIVSAGGNIKSIILPGEFRDVKVVLKSDFPISSVVEKLQMCGTVCTVREGSRYFKVTFENPHEAKQALMTFKNESMFTLQSIVKTGLYDDRLNQYKIFVSCLRRKCKGVAYITIEPSSTLPEIMRILNSSFLTYNCSILEFSLSKKSNDIQIKGLPISVDMRKFQKVIEDKLALYFPGVFKISKLVIPRDNSTSVTVNNVKQSLVQLFSEFTSLEQLNIDVKKPHDKECRWKAFVFFKNYNHGETAFSILKNRQYNSGTLIDLEMKPEIKSRLFCKYAVFDVLKDQITEAIKFFQNTSNSENTLNVDITKKGDNVEIKINSNNVNDMSDVRKAVLNFLLGDKIDCKLNLTLGKLFSVTGKNFLKKLSESKSDCYIDLYEQKKIITIYGNISVCNAVKREINEFLDTLVEDNFKEIKLMPENGKPGALREILKAYGYDLLEFKKKFNLTSVEINLRHHILCVRGSESCVLQCELAIRSITQSFEKSTSNDLIDLNEQEIIEEKEEETCPVCLVPVSQDFHRLEYCGHTYCKECILHLFQNAKTLSFQCLQCDETIVLADIQWAIDQVKGFDNEFLKLAMNAYVENTSDIVYCPSADCQMLFRVTTEENRFECPLCNNIICTKCKEIYHFNMSCSFYQCVKLDDDYSLKVWLSADEQNHRRCPNLTCRSPIEKNGGCNLMTCWKCKNHMCWLCLQIFNSPMEVYNHQPLCPRKC